MGNTNINKKGARLGKIGASSANLFVTLKKVRDWAKKRQIETNKKRESPRVS